MTDKDQYEAEENDNKELFESMKRLLSGKVNKRQSVQAIEEAIRYALSTEGEVTIEMEKILKCDAEQPKM